jgi:hypothetical protein
MTPRGHEAGSFGDLASQVKARPRVVSRSGSQGARAEGGDSSSGPAPRAMDLTGIWAAPACRDRPDKPKMYAKMYTYGDRIQRTEAADHGLLEAGTPFRQ